MMYEIVKNGFCNIKAEDGTEVTAREFTVRIPCADDGVSGVGMVSRTVGSKTLASFDAYTVTVTDGVPAVNTEHKEVEFEGQPGMDKITEAVGKAYPAHGEILTEFLPGETIGLPADLFRALAVKVIRPASQR